MIKYLNIFLFSLIIALKFFSGQIIGSINNHIVDIIVLFIFNFSLLGIITHISKFMDFFKKTIFSFFLSIIFLLEIFLISVLDKKYLSDHITLNSITNILYLTDILFIVIFITLVVYSSIKKDLKKNIFQTILLFALIIVIDWMVYMFLFIVEFISGF